MPNIPRQALESSLQHLRCYAISLLILDIEPDQVETLQTVKSLSETISELESALSSEEIPS